MSNSTRKYNRNRSQPRLKRNADIKDKKNYSKRKAKFNIDIDSEQKAYQIGMNKKNKKSNKQIVLNRYKIQTVVCAYKIVVKCLLQSNSIK